MKKHLNTSITFYMSILFTTIFMGSSFPTGKYLISNEHVPPMLLGGWRFVIAGSMMLILTFTRKGKRAILPTSKGNSCKGFILVFVIGFLQTAGTMGLLNLAMAFGVSSSISSILLFTNPLWLAFLAHFILNERLTKIKIISLILGVFGVGLCLGLDETLLGWGTLFALAGSLCWSINTIVTKKVVFDKGPWVLTGWQLLFGGMFMLIMSLVLKEHYTFSSLNHWGWIWFFWLIIPASAGSFGLWFYSLSQRGATTASSFLFLVPLFSTLFSIIGLREPFTLHLILGGLCVVMALILIHRQPRENIL